MMALKVDWKVCDADCGPRSTLAEGRREKKQSNRSRYSWRTMTDSDKVFAYVGLFSLNQSGFRSLHVADLINNRINVLANVFLVLYPVVTEILLCESLLC